MHGLGARDAHVSCDAPMLQGWTWSRRCRSEPAMHGLGAGDAGLSCGAPMLQGWGAGDAGLSLRCTHAARMGCRRCNCELCCTTLQGLGAGNAAPGPQCAALHGLGAGNATMICSAWTGCRKCSSEPSLNCTARMQRRKCNPELHCMDAEQEMQS